MMPRVYKCRDVYLIIWGKYEWIIPRWHTLFGNGDNERWWLS